MTRHQYGISALVLQPSRHGEASVGIAKCCLFSQAKEKVDGHFFFQPPNKPIKTQRNHKAIKINGKLYTTPCKVTLQTRFIFTIIAVTVFIGASFVAVYAGSLIVLRSLRPLAALLQANLLFPSNNSGTQNWLRHDMTEHSPGEG